MNQDAMARDLHVTLEPLLKARLGDETTLRLEMAATGEIRLEGRFVEKPTEVNTIISEALAELMENFDASGYAV